MTFYLDQVSYDNVNHLIMAFIDHWTDDGTDAHISDEGTTR